jgi:predicted dehydrogenase
LIAYFSGSTGPGGPEFVEFQAEAQEKHGVQFFKSVQDLPPIAAGKKRLALISGRTGDNPKLLTECIEGKISTAAGVTVLMGYNKNVCKYVSKARDYAAANEGSHVTFVSNNAYENSPASLGECFERNREGMLKNMAIHELALLVSFFDVKVETIEKCVADKEFSSCQTLKGPSGQDVTDFDKIKFTITTKSGKSVSVSADRCGGDVSWAQVDKNGVEVFRHSMPDEDDKANVGVLQKEYPGAMPYFFSQDPDYITVKEKVADFCANGTEPTGIATLDTAVETLRVAEYLTPTLTEQLLG